VSRAEAVRAEEAHASREEGESPLTRADYRLSGTGRDRSSCSSSGCESEGDRHARADHHGREHTKFAALQPGTQGRTARAGLGHGRHRPGHRQPGRRHDFAGLNKEYATRAVAGPAAPFLRPPDPDLHAIRNALLPEDVADFGQEFRAVTAEATSARDLTVVGAFIERWRRVAWSAAEPDGHRAMLDRAQRPLAGEDVPAPPWAETQSGLGL
jgi:hypothetical protein